jgi:hypothetical protein
VRGSELGYGRRQVLRRLDRLSDELGLDRERARLWALAQTIAWCPYSDELDRHVETARWLLEARTGQRASASSSSVDSSTTHTV